MSLEKPWDKPYGELLKLVVQKWPGAIRHSGRKTAKDMYLYPTFAGTKNGLPFEIEISEFPDRRLNLYEAEDNVEYLRIFISVKNRHAIRITHENFAQKAGKFFRISHEFQTGSKVFDKKYWLDLNSSQDEILLCNRIFQDKVYQMEPLSLVEISKTGILWSLELTKKSQLSLASLEKRINAALAIAAIIAPDSVPDRPVPIRNHKPTHKKLTMKKIKTPAKPKTGQTTAAKPSKPSVKKTVAKKTASAKKKAAPVKVRCAGTTSDGKRCKRMVTKPDKYCHLHKKKR